MKRGYIILVIGSIILIIGIGLSITSVIDPFLRESTNLSDKVIKPSQSINVSRMVVLSEAAPSPSLALSISSKQPDNKEPLLGEEIKDPHGTIVSKGEFKRQFFTTAQPKSGGNYTVTISNLGNQVVTVNALFAQLPFVNEKNQVQLGTAIAILGGGATFIVGIMLLILGGIILVIDKRKSKIT
jgi:hypothetical protein